MKDKVNKLFCLGGVLFIGALFFVISYWSPLAGDDWWYAVVARYNTPIQAACKQYMAWSGRFLSELWGYLITPNKWAWNIINPMLFMGIMSMILVLAKAKTRLVGCTALVVLLMLSVNDYVRMQTYSWIMGTTYVIPLLLMLIYVYVVRKLVIEKSFNKWLIAAGGLLNITIPLFMENVAAALLVFNVLVIIYCYFEDKRYLKFFILYLIISLVGIAIIRLSPGAVYRLENSHADWTSLSIFEQITSNWQNFIKFTFLDNKYLICILSLIMIAFVIKNRYQHILNDYNLIVVLFIFFMGFIQSISANINARINYAILYPLYDLNNRWCLLITSIIFVSYILALIYVIFTFFRNEEKWELFAVLSIAGSANIAMLLSPIFDSRSSIYTIYFIILFAMMMYERISFKSNRVNYVVILCCVLMTISFTKSYLYKYKLVRDINSERMSQIRYYQDHPEDIEAYFVQMPPLTIHSGDVDEGDYFHHEAFYKYFNLNPEIKLHFYQK